MSDSAVIIPVMGAQITEKALTSWLESEGYTVVEFDGDTQWGYTHRGFRRVGIGANLLSRQRIPSLLHECFHVHLHHDGHQSPRTEDWINEQVAELLVDPAEYAFWEAQYGWNTGGIAAALDLPKWVVKAYRRVLQKRMA